MDIEQMTNLELLEEFEILNTLLDQESNSIETGSRMLKLESEIAKRGISKEDEQEEGQCDFCKEKATKNVVKHWSEWDVECDGDISYDNMVSNLDDALVNLHLCTEHYNSKEWSKR